ncbi:MAG: hypothetical protein F6K47_03300 [Symploca sp. SIO2E6]|nr:hypothetical protein [Symploca sp. SIO2E6]
MNALLPRILKSAYRKEPISSFIVIMGAVNAVIGGVGERWSLLSLGLMMIMLAAIIRWWQTQNQEVKLKEQPVTQYLPANSSRPPLQMVSHRYRQ